MRKCLSCFLAILMVPGISGRTAFASSDSGAEHATRIKVQIDNLAPGTPLKVRLQDHKKITGVFVAQTEDGFRLSGPSAVDLKYTEVKSVSEDPQDQRASAGSTGPQSPHHRHRVVKYAIIVGVAFGLAIALASLDN